MQNDELAQLDHEFNTGGEMHLEVYRARREAILEKRRREPLPAATPPPAPKPAEPGITRSQLRAMMKGVARAVRDHVKTPLQNRIEELEKLLKSSATRAEAEEIQKLKARIEPLEAMPARLATVETRCGALALSLGRSNPEGALELEALMARVKSLESRPTLQFRGVWREDEDHRVGDFVSFDGSLWHCWQNQTKDKPGTSAAWQLAVKHGRDLR